MSSVAVVACARHGSSPSQTETWHQCNHSRILVRLSQSRRYLLTVAALQQHVPRAPGHACAGGSCGPSQTDAPSNATVAAMAPDSTQTEPELWSVLPVAALHSTYLDQPHLSIHRHLHTHTLSRPRSHVTRAPGVMLVVYRIP